jgi:hypothetical protein
VVSKADAHDLFFNLHDFENYSAIAPEAIARRGKRANLSIGTSNESILSPGLQANPVLKNRGCGLSLEDRFEHYHIIMERGRPKTTK